MDNNDDNNQMNDLDTNNSNNSDNSDTDEQQSCTSDVVKNTECPVCLCDIGSEIHTFTFSCHHALHTDCATDFVYNQFKNQSDIFCPICRFVEFPSSCDDYISSYLRLFPNAMFVHPTQERIVPQNYVYHIEQDTSNRSVNVIIQPPFRNNNDFVITIRNREFSMNRYTFKQVIISLCVLLVMIVIIGFML